MPSARNKTVAIERACVTVDGIAIYHAPSRSEPGVTHHAYLNLTNGQCDCDCKRQCCLQWPALRDAGYSVLTIWMPRYHCIHIRLAIADSIARGERQQANGGAVGEINVLEPPVQADALPKQETTMPHARPVAMAKIRTDSTAQFRAELNENHVHNLMDSMENGAKLPSVTIYRDPDGTHWLADGFHTYEAHRRLDREEILAELIPGTQRDAVLHGAGANADHGLPRSNADKRRAVTRLLDDEEWGQWKTPEIATVCRVTPQYVNLVKREREETDKPTEDVTGNVSVASQAGPPPAAAETSQDSATGQGGATTATGRQSGGKGAQSAGNGVSGGVAQDDATPDLTDDEWLGTIPLWRELCQRQHHGIEARRDLLGYRTLSQGNAISGFAHHAARAVNFRDGGGTHFRNVVLAAAHLPCPHTWRLCVRCKGDGCAACGYAGYDMLTGNPLEAGEANE